MVVEDKPPEGHRSGTDCLLQAAGTNPSPSEEGAFLALKKRVPSVKGAVGMGYVVLALHLLVGILEGGAIHILKDATVLPSKVG